MQDAEGMLSDLKHLESESRTLVSEVAGKTDALLAAIELVGDGLPVSVRGWCYKPKFSDTFLHKKGSFIITDII